MSDAKRFLDAFFESARTNDVEGLDAAIGARKIDVETRDRSGFRALHHASALGCEEAVEALARRRAADADGEDADGRTALHHAAANGRDEVVKRLIDDCEAWIDAVDGRDETPLLCACRQGDASTVKILLARGADPRARNVDGNDALTEALCVRGDVEMAKIIIAAGVDPKKTRAKCGKMGPNAGRSLLNVACAYGTIQAVRFLIDDCGLSASGEDAGDVDYMTPLMAAAMMAQVEVIEYLLLSGATQTAHLKTEDDLTAADLFPSTHPRKDVKKRLEEAIVKAGRTVKPRSVAKSSPVELPAKWKTTKKTESLDPIEVRMRSWIAAGVEKYEGVPAHVRHLLERYVALTKEVELREFLLGIIQDEDFQEHMQIENVREAVNDVVENFHNVTKYRGNALVMNVLNKFRHVQRFCKDRGEKITFSDILAEDEDVVEAHKERLAELKAATGVAWDDALMTLKSHTTGEDMKSMAMSVGVRSTWLMRAKGRMLDVLQDVAMHSIAAFVFAVTLAVFWRLGGFHEDELSSFAT